MAKSVRESGNLTDEGDKIVAALTGNASFPTTTPTLAQVSTAIAGLRKAVAAPESPGRAPAIDAARLVLSDLLQQLGQNLAGTTGVTEAMLATTGFKLPKAATRTTTPPPAPGNIRLSHGQNPGEVIVRCSPADGTRSYDVEWALDPNAGPWTDAGAFASTRGIELSGLPRGKDVWCACAPSAWRATARGATWRRLWRREPAAAKHRAAAACSREAAFSGRRLGRAPSATIFSG